MSKSIDDLSINTENAFAFEQELKEYSETLNEVYTALAKTNTTVERLELAIKIKTAEIVEDICTKAIEDKKPIPKSAIQELKNTSVPLDPDWQKLNKELIEAKEQYNILKGLAKSHESRGYRIGELGKLMENMMRDNLVVFEKGKRIKTQVADATKSLEF